MYLRPFHRWNTMLKPVKKLPKPAAPKVPKVIVTKPMTKHEEYQAMLAENARKAKIQEEQSALKHAEEMKRRANNTRKARGY